MRFQVFALVMFFCGLTPVFAEDGLIIRGAEKTVVLKGYTHSRKTMTLSTEISGRVAAVHYEIGDVIQKAPFLEIDTTLIDLQIKNVRQSIAAADNTILKARSGIRFLEKEFVRIDALFASNLATEKIRDAAAHEQDSARHDLEALKIEKARLGISLDELQERRRRHQITAPAGWIVTARRAEAGEVIGPGVPIGEAADFQVLVVPASVSGAELEALNALAPPFSARIEDKPVNARINWVNPKFNERTRKLDIELAVSAWDGEKRGGLQFTMDINLPTNGLRVPKEAVANRYDNPKVYLKDSGDAVSVLILGENAGDLIIASNPRLAVGARLSTPP